MRILLLACCLLCAPFIKAQTDVLQKPDILPPSPEAAAFAKNINIPISYSSGTPQISVPFYTVKSGGIEIPVSISYNASGIRVDETATWVGLGWSLSAGGQISRTMRGTADERPTWGYMNVYNNRKVKYVDSAHCRCSEGSTEQWGIENDIIDYQLDLEPDQFSFSVLGYSGDFVYNQDSARFILIPYQNILVEGTPGDFTLTLPNGIKAYFGGESIYHEIVTSGTTTSYVDGISYAPEYLQNTPYSNSWALKEIIDPLGKTVQFTYVSEYITSFGIGGERYGQSVTGGDNQMRRQSFYRQYITKPVLQKISGDNVDVYFKRSSSSRLDVPSLNGGSRSLDTIVVKNKNDVEVKSFYFKYGYFVSPSYSVGHILTVDIYAEEARRRLYLKSVTEKRGTDSLPPTEFTYSDIELPSRFSTAQDYWGYYNGKTNGIYMMPKLRLPSFNHWDPNADETNGVLPGFGYANTDGAERRIDTNFTQARILKKVKYPTGGTTEYYYEQNQASTGYLSLYSGVVPPDAVDKSYTFSLLSNPMPINPPYPLYFSGVFSVDIPVSKLKITVNMQSPCGLYNDPACLLTTKIRSLPDSNLLMTFTTNITSPLQVDKGDYLVEVLSTASPDNWPPNFTVTIGWSERSDSLNFIVGGVRVKKIVSNDGVGKTITRSFKYNLDSLAMSSGIVEGCATYMAHGVNEEGNVFRRYFVSNSVLPLTMDGKTIKYQYVSEYYDSTQTSYRTDYVFNPGLSDPRLTNTAHTEEPYLSWSWQTFLKNKKVYEKLTNGSYRILSEEESFYLPHEPNQQLYGLFGSQIIPYDIVTEWWLPQGTTTKTYSYEGSQPVVSISSTSNEYNNKYLQSKAIIVNSKGETIHSKTWYPTDFNNVSGYNIQALIDKHIWALPMKQETSINGKVISGSVIKYNENGLLLDGYAYENASLTDTSAHNPNTVLPSNYQLKTSLRYDDQDNIKQINNYKSGPGNYIWDYQVNGITGGRMNEMPMAMVQNADSNHVAYSSFENVSKGGWSYSGTPTTTTAVTGAKVYPLSGGNITKSGLSSTSIYIVSYWSSAQKTVSNTSLVRTGATYNGWTYYEHKVVNPSSGTITVSGSGNIDELRLYPQNAQMNSYAYNDLWMVSAMCDVNNRISYYEYDNFGRLSLVRDQSGYILKKICYNYAGQPENCGMGNDAQWQVDSIYCEKSGGENTTNQIKRERDTNPNSSTYNQTRNVIISNAFECPPACSTSNCVGNDKKCVNGVCETGVKIYTGSTRVSGSIYRCYYHYQWSDNSISATYEEYPHSGPCMLN